MGYVSPAFLYRYLHHHPRVSSLISQLSKEVFGIVARLDYLKSFCASLVNLQLAVINQYRRTTSRKRRNHPSVIVVFMTGSLLVMTA